MVEIPVLETERLILRGHRLEDFEHTAALWSNPQVTLHIGGRPFSREESWSRLLRYVGHWTLLGYGFWAVAEKSSGQFVGEAGLADFQRDIDLPADVPPLASQPEIGWVLKVEHHGKGYATEAARAITQWADRTFPGGRTACIINTDNFASRRVAEKCGYRLIVETRYKDCPILRLGRAAAATGL
jgi:RimJ/RimL family protein N-acetyltransferase